MMDGKTELVVSDVYHIESPFDLINLEMMYAVICDMPINRCKNCNNFFVAGNAAAIYCDRIFTNGKTCKQFGGKKAFTDNLKKDEALLQYEKAYQATYYKYKRAASGKEKSALHQQILTLKNLRIRYKHGDISAAEFSKLIHGNG